MTLDGGVREIRGGDVVDLTHSLETYGYPFVFGVLFLESLGIPMPSELTLVTAGVLAGQGAIQPLFVILAGAAGSTAGALVSYTIGLRGGRRLILRWGGRIGLTEERMTHVERFFGRGGFWAVLGGRVVSGIRAIISYPAGFFRMPLPRFVAATVIGALIWPILAVELGRVIGSYWGVIVGAIPRGGIWVGVVLILALGVGAIWWRTRGRRRP